MPAPRREQTSRNHACRKYERVCFRHPFKRDRWENTVRSIALIVALFGVQLTHAQNAPDAAAAAQAEPIQHEYVIKNFKTESGAVLPEARIVYGTYGKLNAKGDNAILLPSHYMAEMHGYGWLIGPGKALDPKKLFLI